MITRPHSVLSSRTPNTKRTTATTNNDNTNTNYNDKTNKLKISAWRKSILFISIPILAFILTHYYLSGFIIRGSTKIVKEHDRVHPNQVIPEIPEITEKLEVFI